MLFAWDAIFRYQDGVVECSGAFTWFLVGLIAAILFSR